MNGRKEKYYNYVVDDMVRNTEIDFIEEFILFPFNETFHITLTLPPYEFTISGELLHKFYHYIMEMYGVNVEELSKIFTTYIGRMNSLENSSLTLKLNL